MFLEGENDYIDHKSVCLLQVFYQNSYTCMLIVMQKQVLIMTLTAKLNALNFDVNLTLIYINGNTLESLKSQSYFSRILRVSRTIFIYILNELFYTVYFFNFIVQIYKQHARLFYPIEEYIGRVHHLSGANTVNRNLINTKS